MNGLWKFFMWFSKQTAAFRSLRDNETVRKESVMFGVRSILFVSIGCMVSAAIALGGMYLTGSGNIALIILGVLLIAAGALSALNFFARSMYCALLQLRLNKKPIGYVAVILCILLTALILIGIVMLADHVL